MADDVKETPDAGQAGKDLASKAKALRAAAPAVQTKEAALDSAVNEQPANPTPESEMAPAKGQPTFTLTPQLERAAKSLKIDPARIANQEAADLLLAAQAEARRQTGKAGQQVAERDDRIRQLESDLAAAKTAQVQPASTDQAPKTLEQLTEEYGPEMAQVIFGQNQRAERLERKLVEIERAQSSVLKPTEQEQWDTFDSFVLALPTDQKAIFGEGKTSDLDPADPETVARRELFDSAELLRSKRPQMAMDESVSAAYRALYPEQHDKTVAQKATEAALARNQARRDHRTMSPANRGSVIANDPAVERMERARGSFAKAAVGD